MRENAGLIRFFYCTALGRILLKWILTSRIDRFAVRFLWSRLSSPLAHWYVRRYQIPLKKWEEKKMGSFREFFSRKKVGFPIDMEPDHLISPCDGWLSVCPIEGSSCFSIKGSQYHLEDLLRDEEIAKTYYGGDCLIIRLNPSDYHHYCYIDDGYQGKNHYIPGQLHSVHPIACEAAPVYTLNRRSWTLMVTEHFGPVVQTEVGALIVGGICNPRENTRFVKGMEKGHFELAGSTIALLFQKDRICLNPDIRQITDTGAECRVEMGMWIGTSGRS